MYPADKMGIRKRNLTAIVAFSFLSFAGRSLWVKSCLSIYLHIISDGNPLVVGWLTSLMGVAQLTSSLVAGYAADMKFPGRIGVLRFATIFGALSFLLTAWAAWNERIAPLSVAHASWGIYWGAVIPPVGAIVADATAAGDDRTKWITRRFVAQKYGQASGPAAALVLFLLIGDEWTARHCALVICAGQIVSFFAAVLLCWLKDDRDNESASELDGPGSYSRRNDRCWSLSWMWWPFQKRNNAGKVISPNLLASNEHHVEQCENDDKLIPLLLESGDAELATSDCSDSTAPDSNDSTAPDSDDNRDSEWLQLEVPTAKSRKIAQLIVLADIYLAIAQGMTGIFFPVFFKDFIGFPPTKLFPLFVVAQILQAETAKLMRFLGRRFGRLRTSFAGRWASALALFLLIHSYQAHLSHIVTCLLYLVHVCALNAPKPLAKGVLMDNVPESERARWTSLESINQFSWTGSAVLGSVIVHRWGILWNFRVTALLQLLAATPLILLFDDER